MSVISIDYHSEALGRSVNFKMIVPNDVPPIMVQGNPHYIHPTKTLFLLHGYSGDNTDWMLQAPAMNIALHYNLAIVFPNGENSFYLDRLATGCKYSTFIGQELPHYLHRVFGLCAKPEETFVGGLSMGGFGSLYAGLAHPGTFSRAFSLSGALIIHNVAQMKPEQVDAVANYAYYREVFGDPATVLESHNNPETLVRNLLTEGKALPELYMAIGTEDPLLNANRIFRDFLQDRGVTFTYHESAGIHDFKFWNEYLEPAVRWALGLPEIE